MCLMALSFSRESSLKVSSGLSTHPHLRSLFTHHYGLPQDDLRAGLVRAGLQRAVLTSLVPFDITFGQMHSLITLPCGWHSSTPNPHSTPAHNTLPGSQLRIQCLGPRHKVRHLLQPAQNDPHTQPAAPGDPTRARTHTHMLVWYSGPPRSERTVGPGQSTWTPRPHRCRLANFGPTRRP